LWTYWSTITQKNKPAPAERLARSILLTCVNLRRDGIADTVQRRLQGVQAGRATSSRQRYIPIGPQFFKPFC
jgi:hypothetical protein